MTTFNRHIANIKRSGKSVRDNIQAAVVIALNHYQQHADTQYLTQLMDAANSSSAVRTQTLKNFIQGHANVTYVKNKKTNTNVFKKKGKGEPETQEVNTPWWNYDKSGEATPQSMDVVAQAKRLITNIQKAEGGENNKKIKDGQEETAHNLVAALNQVLAS